MGDEDEVLRRRLRRADPAAEADPAAARRLEQITETIMSSSIRTPAPAGTEGDARRPRWILPVALTGAAAAIAAAVVIGTGGGASPTRFVAPEAVGPATSCAVLTAEGLAMNEVAFAATVTSVDGDEVALAVTERFRGEVTDEVIVAQGTDPNLEYSTGEFVAGGDYLVAVTDGAAASCGLTGPESPELRALYEEAFAG
ncbi:hypothetical protein [Microcella flavibacter]|uniref:hypothetical protein n=1 Tax=Microcella flavibacter TaxID=1804990 RepID=UPI00145788FA|nr:hypothetical protein [Microcella flavibacter]